MSGSQIAAEVAAGILEAATELSDGGFSLSIIRTAGTQTSPWGLPTGTVTEIPVTGIVTEYPQKMIDGTLIRAGDRMVTLAATGTVPTVADKIKVGSDIYNIVMVKPLSPAGVDLMYEIQCRR